MNLRHASALLAALLAALLGSTRPAPAQVTPPLPDSALVAQLAEVVGTRARVVGSFERRLYSRVGFALSIRGLAPADSARFVEQVHAAFGPSIPHASASRSIQIDVITRKLGIDSAVFGFEEQSFTRCRDGRSASHGTDGKIEFVRRGETWAAPIGISVDIVGTSLPCGEDTGPSLPQSFRDSVATRVVLAAVLAEMSSSLAATVSDSTLRPWSIRLPDHSSIVDWRALRRELTRLIRAREEVSTDTLVHVLTIQRFEESSDSLFVRYYLGIRWRCGTKWRGSGTAYEFTLDWSRFNWVPKRTTREHGDSLPCQFAGTES